MRVELIGEDNTVLVSSPAPSVPDGYEVAKGEYRCMKDGELILVRHSDGWQWDDWDNCPKLMNPGHIATRKLKQIDMARMKGQYCVYAHGIFIRHDTDDDCTPIYGHTYAHTGGECPIPEGFDYKVTLADRVEYTREELVGRVHCWKFSDDNYDEQNPARLPALFYVINFTITGILPGWEL